MISHRNIFKEEINHVVNSPIVSTFYSSSNLESENFVKIGSKVILDAIVCII